MLLTCFLPRPATVATLLPLLCREVRGADTMLAIVTADLIINMLSAQSRQFHETYLSEVAEDGLAGFRDLLGL